VKLHLPRKRTILAFHRWLGVFSAMFLFLLAMTGLALNHTERLGLNKVTINNGLILARYGMASASEMAGYRIHDTTTLVHFQGRLYHEAAFLAEADFPVGLHEGEGFSIIAVADALIYLTPEGELIEQVGILSLPFGRIDFMGTAADGQAVLVTDEGPLRPDADWLEFSSHEGAFTVVPLQAAEVGDDLRKTILAGHQGSGPTLYRVLLDLHSGRLFGWGGRTLMDLTAVAILLLLSSGVAGWLRRSTWGRR
jgi:hypothetical protein